MSIELVATGLGAIYVVIQILDRLYPRSNPEFQSLVESQKLLTDEVKNLTRALTSFMEVGAVRHDALLGAIRESRAHGK